MDAAQVLMYVFFTLIAVLALSCIFAPIRMGLKLIINAVFGFLGLLVASIFGDFIGISISINLLTLSIAALLGVPGLVAIILMYILF